MPLSTRSVSPMLVAALLVSVAGCGREEVKYKPRPAPKTQITMPAVPNVPQTPIKRGDVYTVWGASYSLRSRVFHKDIEGKPLTLEGYIVDTNLPQAPECAVHKGGKADPETCKPPVPTFWVGDEKTSAKADCIRVMGWASNFAQIFDTIKELDEKGDKAKPHQDEFWGKEMPVPIPAKGAKVRVTGPYSTTFTGASTGAEADPIMGILTYTKVETLEEAPELATLPGVKRKEKKD